MTSQQANASTFRRPEITRSSDNLAKDQRKMLETQRRRLQFTENIQRREFNALIESKIYSNFQNNVDYCMNICENKKQTILASPLSQLYSDSNGKNSVKTDLNMSCLNNCIQKKYESFDMLMHYFFAKMKLNENTKDDFKQLYDIPDKFKSKHL